MIGARSSALTRFEWATDRLGAPRRPPSTDAVGFRGRARRIFAVTARVETGTAVAISAPAPAFGTGDARAPTVRRALRSERLDDDALVSVTGLRSSVVSRQSPVIVASRPPRSSVVGRTEDW